MLGLVDITTDLRNLQYYSPIGIYLGGNKNGFHDVDVILVGKQARSVFKTDSTVPLARAVVVYPDQENLI